MSFVGVDLNTSSVALLTKISGLTNARAKKIAEWREQNGAFVNRDQLKLVSGLGPKSFEQVRMCTCTGLDSCAGLGSLMLVSWLGPKSFEQLRINADLDSCDGFGSLKLVSGLGPKLFEQVLICTGFVQGLAVLDLDPS